MNDKSFIVIVADRLDRLIASSVEMSRSQAVERIKAGGVHVNGVVCTKPAKKLAVHDAVVVTIDDAESELSNPISVESSEMDYPILYEDDNCFVVNKPPGVIVHGAATRPDEDSIVAVVRRVHGKAVDLVHRLDRDTSGCLLLSRNNTAHQALQKQFKDRTVQKEYMAIVAGVPEKKSAMIDAAIGRSLVARTKMSLFRTSTSREAKTSYDVLDESAHAALMRCVIHTGRMHQIRVHLLAIDHPILGDERYVNRQSRDLTKQYDVPRVMLHAHRLVFESAGKKVEVIAPVPEDMKKVMKNLDLSMAS